MSDAPIIKDKPRCEAPGCGMLAEASTNAVNHCGVHEGWAKTDDAVRDIARRQGINESSPPLTGYTCRCGAAWDAAGAQVLGDSIPEIASSPSGHRQVGHQVFERIGRGSLRDFQG